MCIRDRFSHNFTGPDLRGIWPQWFLELSQHGADAYGTGGQFIGALFVSHYLWVVVALQIAGGALLLVNRFVPLGLVLLGPVIVNIICYHVFLNPSGAIPAAVVTVLWFVVFYSRRQYFSGIFAQQTSDK